MYKKRPALLFLLLTVSFFNLSLYAQNEASGPVFTVSETVHDFGLINETDMEALHIFKVKNTGDAPLVITHVQSSCGCAEPQWTAEPIQPGQYGEVAIIYSTTNRPGPFKKNITVYTNEKKRRQRLTIQGDVIPKPKELNAVFNDTIGVIQMEYRDFLFHTIRPKEVSVKEIWIQNISDKDISLAAEDVPAHIKIELPEKLASRKPQRLKITLDGSAIDTRGRLISKLKLKTKSESGQTETDFITVAANFIDDFGKLTPAERKESPTIELSATLVDFGKLKKRGKAVSQQFTITNEGESPLILHSISADNPLVETIALKNKTLQPGETTNVQLRISPKKVKSSIDTDVYIICNDARGPVRQIKVTAEK